MYVVGEVIENLWQQSVYLKDLRQKLLESVR